MSGTSLDLSQIRTDALTSAATFRTLIGVYSTADVDGLIAAITALTSEDIDTLAEINAIIGDADVASVSYVDGLAANYATAAQGALADTALQSADITSGAITAGTGDIDFDALGGAGSPLVLTASLATEVPLTVKAAASQTANLTEWQDNAGTNLTWVDKLGNIYLQGAASRLFRIYMEGSNPVLDATVGAASARISLKGAPVRLMGNVEFSNVTNQIMAQIITSSFDVQLIGNTAGSFSISIPQSSNGNQGNETLSITGQTAEELSTNVIVGGDVVITAGDGASASAGAADGGDLILQGGTGYGTGRQGLILASNLPTSDPTVAGALWNDSGTLKISVG